MHSFFDALTMLTPFDIDIGKILVGPNGDGGYVLADRLSPDQTVLSYGISEQFDFDLAISQAGHSVLMFDHTIDIPTIYAPRVRFFQEGCSAASDGDKLFSIADHLEKNEVIGDRLIFKMDVEGAEYETILAVPEHVLQRFEQIVGGFIF